MAPQVMHGKQSQIQLEAPSPLYAGVAKEVPVMRYHSLTIEDMPEDFVITSRTTDDQAIMGIQHRSLPIYGFQYHPESIGTPDGLKTIENFVKLVKERKMKQVLAKVAEGMDLTSAELEAAMEEVVAGRVSEAQVTALLLGLKMKGETVEERTAIAKVMQAYAVAIPTEVQGAMDNCGTGGDRSYSFNISTTAAFVLAGGGIKMAKHGNRSISSKSGSADVLEALGINLDLGPGDLGRVFEKAGIVFLFAKNLHPGHALYYARSLGTRGSNGDELNWSSYQSDSSRNPAIGNQSSRYAGKYGGDSKEFGSETRSGGEWSTRFRRGRP